MARLAVVRGCIAVLVLLEGTFRLDPLEPGGHGAVPRQPAEDEKEHSKEGSDDGDGGGEGGGSSQQEQDYRRLVRKWLRVLVEELYWLGRKLSPVVAHECHQVVTTHFDLLIHHHHHLHLYFHFHFHLLSTSLTSSCC